jgi:hypothetical protein
MVDSVTTECSSTTPHLGGRDEAAANVRKSSASMARTSSFAGLMGTHHHPHHGQVSMLVLSPISGFLLKRIFFSLKKFQLKVRLN